MELLIPGLILVALMIYASTRIKKTAALAFESETIVGDGFVIEKPEGFLTVIGGDPQFAFEAYSREFGGAGAEEFRQATAKLKIYDAAAGVPQPDGEVLDERSEVIDDDRYRIVEAKSTEKDVELRIFYKIAERDSRIYMMKVITLSETTAELKRNIETMLDSFELK